MKECNHCGKPIRTRDGRNRHTAESFKATFKVGDYISGWATGLTLEITAIGRQRVLLWDEKRRKERIALQSAQHGWTIVHQPTELR